MRVASVCYNTILIINISDLIHIWRFQLWYTNIVKKTIKKVKKTISKTLWLWYHSNSRHIETIKNEVAAVGLFYSWLYVLAMYNIASVQ